MIIPKSTRKAALRACLSILAGAICSAGNLEAAQIQGVSISAFSSQNYTYPSTATYSVTNLVSNAGLFGDVHCFLPGGCMWLSAAGPSVGNYVTFNLGGLYTVNAIKVWNYNDSSFISGANGRVQYGVSNAVVSYSTDGVNFTTSIASQNFNEGHGNFTPYAQYITLPAPVAAQYIRFDIKTNWGGGTAGVGLAKVRFVSNTNPPAVLSASENYGSNQVTVLFSESVNLSSATNPANYSLSGSGAAPTISNVAMGEYLDRVILYTSPLTNNNYSVHVSGVYDEAVTSAVTNNSTVPVQSELFLWLRADQGVTTTSAFGGNMVTAWNDQSSYGHNAQPANFFGVLTNGPFLATGVVNGEPSLEFFGTNVLQIPNDAANPLNGDFTLFLAISPAASTVASEPFSKTGGGSSATSTNNLAAPLDFYFAANTLKPTLNIGNNGCLGTSFTPNQAPTAGSFYVMAVSITATNLGQIIVNGSSPLYDLTQSPAFRPSADLLMAGAPQDAGNPFAIGARNCGPSSQPFSGDISEIMLIRGTITPGDLASIETYLGAKYAIAPVTISEDPASLTANAGSEATFWVGASGMQPFSYQWYSNTVAIIGATNMSYSTPYLTASANGASYTVTVSNPSGSANSAAATLAVVTPTSGPTVFSAAKTTGLTNVLVVFSEAIDSTTALNPNNYSIDGGISVVSASAGSVANQVVLKTSLLNANGLYHLSIQNVKDLYGNAMVAVTVPLMPASLTMWLRADSGVVTNANAGNPTEIDAWLDQTANGNNAQSYGIGPNYRPTIGNDSAANNEPAVFFSSGSPNFLVAAGSPGLNMAGDMSLYEVFNVAGGYSGYRSLISKANSGTRGNSYDLYLQTSSGQVKWNRGDGTSYHTGTLTGIAPPAGVPVAFAMVHQGTGIQPAQDVLCFAMGFFIKVIHKGSG